MEFFQELSKKSLIGNICNIFVNSDGKNAYGFSFALDWQNEWVLNVHSEVTGKKSGLILDGWTAGRSVGTP